MILLLLAGMILALSARPLRPELDEVLKAQKTSIGLAGIDNFIAWNIGRPGGVAGDPSLTGSLYGNAEVIKNTLLHFESIRDDLAFLRDKVSTFINSPTAFQKCDDSLATSYFHQHLYEQLDLLKNSAWTLDQVHQVMNARGLSSRGIYELSPSELVKVFAPLPYGLGRDIDSAAGDLRFHLNNPDVDPVCSDLNQQKLNLRNEGALLRIGAYNGASYEGLEYKFIDRNEEDWKAGDFQAYKQYSRDLNRYNNLTRLNEDVIRLTSLPITQFYSAYPQHMERIRDIFRRYTGDQIPFIVDSNLKFPIKWASLYFPLFVTLANIFIIASFLGAAKPDDGFGEPIRLAISVKSFLLLSMPLAASLLLSLINLPWYNDPEVIRNVAGYGNFPKEKLSTFIADELGTADPSKDLSLWIKLTIIHFFSFALVVHFWLLSARRLAVR
ncbi:hypothetical protein [Rhizobium sp. L43]|uniref:hypothetical protein n=1 Tax=Rhizobium sp. L43 TaxID=2035452 RepID=UPI000BEA765D|nr:hypothetical protein [Rhizobium sp. L43]PDS74724.1 hypothetical protein CO667_30520 [Rhizobium sp. L43]